MIAEPPVSAGATQVRTTDALSGVPERPVDIPGLPTGVISALAEEAVPAPIAVVAVTRKV